MQNTFYFFKTANHITDPGVWFT